MLTSCYYYSDYFEQCSNMLSSCPLTHEAALPPSSGLTIKRETLSPQPVCGGASFHLEASVPPEILRG